jgi:hypothetical protein
MTILSLAIYKCIKRKYKKKLNDKSKRYRVTIVQVDVCSLVYDVSNLLSFFSKKSRDWVASFYRRCLSLIYYLFQCLTEDRHCYFHLPTIEKYTKMLVEMYEKHPTA